MTSVLLVGLGVGLNYFMSSPETREKARAYLAEMFDKIKEGFEKGKK